ncbi:MAG TPA: hypothetical protein DDZ81_11115 [Acetobacteraceae bacterium]|jgi:hypothetical protein|nr:hypothetical protein [Acetobacteraceae bacterium]
MGATDAFPSTSTSPARARAGTSGAPVPEGGTHPSAEQLLEEERALGRLALLHPCHALVRPPRVETGAVLDVVTPLTDATAEAARTHLGGGGVVRFHGRMPADLAAARAWLQC